ncbi:MAG: hypothetical protein ACNYPE_06250 [Candidatus Azotimanducaceae bacterium WSBS_2022_MAG_OTU7]
MGIEDTFGKRSARFNISDYQRHPPENTLLYQRSDRPYKKAKPVSVAIDIIHTMGMENHIDKGCFELFLRNRVYLLYAQEFLPASQFDEVNVEQYLTA